MPIGNRFNLLTDEHSSIFFRLKRFFFVGWTGLVIALIPGIIIHTGVVYPLVACVFMFLLCMLYNGKLFSAKLRTRHLYNTVIVLLLLGMFVLLFVCGKAMLSEPFSDAGTVYYSTVEIATSGSVSKEINDYTPCYWSTGTSNNDYFLIYPHSLFLVAYLLPVMKFIVHILRIDPYSNSGWFSIIIFNCVSIVSSVAIGSFTIKIIKGKKAGLMFLILSMLFLPNYMNTYKVYSDTLSMPYITLSLLLLALGDRSVGMKRLMYRLFTGISLAISMLLKGSAAILTVGITIWLLLDGRSKGREKYSGIICMLGVFALILCVWGTFSRNNPWIDQRKRDMLELPKMHWVLMGAVGDAGYNQDILDFSMSYDTYKAKEKAEKDVYIQMIKRYGIKGYLSFLYNKMTTILADGRYYQQSHMAYFSKEKGIGKVVNSEGKYNSLLIALETCFMWLFYIAFIYAMIDGITCKSMDETFLYALCSFGLIVFFTFWEFKSRYLMNYTPMFMMNLITVVTSRNARHRNRLNKPLLRITKS